MFLGITGGSFCIFPCVTIKFILAGSHFGKNKYSRHPKNIGEDKMMRKGLYGLTSKVLVTALVLGLYPGTLNVRAEDKGAEDKGGQEIATCVDSTVNTPLDGDYFSEKDSPENISKGVFSEGDFSKEEDIKQDINEIEAIVEVPAEIFNVRMEAMYAGDSDSYSITSDYVYTKTAGSLVNTILGEGIEAVDCKKTGTVYTFSGGTDAIGIESGIVLDNSGKVAGANDPDLAKILTNKYGGHTSSLEFTMTASGSLLNFNYAFASAEFNQSASFNDVFGLFVSVNGGAYENIALITRSDGTTVPVNITNLRAGISGTEMSKGSSTKLVAGAEHSLFNHKKVTVNNSATNGVSLVFNAKKEVNVGDTVKVKFAICDVGDTSVNSSVFIQAESLRFEAPGAKPKYGDENLRELKEGVTYKISSKDTDYYITADEDGCIPLIGKDQDDQEYDFIGKDISIIQVDKNRKEVSDKQDITIAARPDAPKDPSVPTEKGVERPVNVKEADIKTGEDKIEINNAKDENQYSIDGKNWISPVEGKVLFENLDPDKEYTVYTRVAATDEAPSSVSSEGVKVKTYKMLGYCNVEVEGYSDKYDGKYHCPKVVSEVEGLKVTWADNENGLYKPEPIKYKNVGKHIVYFKAQKEGFYPTYGSFEINIEKRPISIKADHKTKEYKKKDCALSYSLADDSEIPENETLKGELVREPGEELGEYIISQGSLTNEDNPNYEITFEEAEFEITKRNVTLIADDKEKIFGAEDEELTFKISEETPLAEGEEIDDVVSLKLLREEGEKAGDYIISAEDISSDNYEVTFVNGTYHILKEESGAVFNIKKSEGISKAEIDKSADEMLDMVLSDEDKELVKDGAGVEVYFEISKIDDLSGADKEVILKNAGEGFNLSCAFDISLYKKFNHLEIEQIHEIDSPVRFKIGLDAKNTEIPQGYNREYKVFRIHNGEVEEISGNVSMEELELESDRFSSFVVAYKDTKIKEATVAKAEPEPVAIQTGDSTPVKAVIAIMIIALLGMGVVVVEKERNE